MYRASMLATAVSLAGLAGMGLAQDNPKTQADKPSAPLLMKKYTIRDVERNNAQPLATVLAPADWQAQSDMKWTLASATIPFALRAKFTAPGGTAAVEFFAIPQGALNISPMGTQGSMPEDVIAALTQLAQANRPQARMRLVDKKAQRPEKIGGQKGPFAQTATVAQTGAIRVTYEENGRTFEEEFAGTLQIMTTSAGQGYETRQWFVEFPRSIKAVQGKLGDVLPVGQAMCRSARPTPEFLMAIQVAAQMVVNIRMQDLNLTMLEGKMWQEANRKMSDEWKQTCDERWVSDQRVAEQRRDILGAVHRFVNDSGKEVIAPATFRHLWESNGGAYLLTNDASFRPGPEFKGDWTQLRPKK